MFVSEQELVFFFSYSGIFLALDPLLQLGLAACAFLLLVRSTEVRTGVSKIRGGCFGGAGLWL